GDEPLGGDQSPPLGTKNDLQTAAAAAAANPPKVVFSQPAVAAGQAPPTRIPAADLTDAAAGTAGIYRPAAAPARGTPSGVPIPTIRSFGARDITGRLPIARALDQVETGPEPLTSKATEEVLARLNEALPEIAHRFPGRLWVDRFHCGGRTIRASQHGPLLALIVRIGQSAAPLLAELMGSSDREIRYYSTLAAGEIRATSAIPGLVARLFDPDYGVHLAALDSLLAFPPSEVVPSLQPARRMLQAGDTAARAAAHALAQLRDVQAIPALIETLERARPVAEEAHRALVELSKQDFGTKIKKWRSWWEKNQARPRIAWLIDGLASASEPIRSSASEELRRLTGEYFGYHADLPKREREESRLRWLKWWEQTGRHRFTR
ncbi:MAG: HEAT repeat domain-containing protein, partial [Pseudomonadota bacterium]